MFNIILPEIRMPFEQTLKKEVCATLSFKSCWKIPEAESTSINLVKFSPAFNVAKSLQFWE